MIYIGFTIYGGCYSKYCRICCNIRVNIINMQVLLCLYFKGL
nr:MAG TPA: hypothetical protein [Caudoviricetes sp.]